MQNEWKLVLAQRRREGEISQGDEAGAGGGTHRCPWTTASQNYLILARQHLPPVADSALDLIVSLG